MYYTIYITECRSAADDISSVLFSFPLFPLFRNNTQLLAPVKRDNKEGRKDISSGAIGDGDDNEEERREPRGEIC